MNIRLVINQNGRESDESGRSRKSERYLAKLVRLVSKLSTMFMFEDHSFLSHLLLLVQVVQFNSYGPSTFTEFLAFTQKVAIYPAVFLACHQIERLHQLIQITQIKDGQTTHLPIRNRIQRFQIMNHFKNHSKLLYSKKLMPNKLVSMNKLIIVL